MARNRKQDGAVASPAQLQARLDRARAEGRTQTALDLARQLFTLQPTATHREQLKEASLARARQLHAQGHPRDAQAILEAALRFDESDPAWVERVAIELARVGGTAQASAFLDRLPPDSPSRDALLRSLADAAVEHEGADRAHLPAALLPELDAVLTAFAHVARGEDDAARQALQVIGLRSPFLEWKLLLRGLMAYYGNDDARALENWQRLDPERLPARLCAAYRSRIDPAYRAAQPPATQTALRRQLDRLEGSALARQLRTLGASLARGESLRSAWRQAEALLPELRRQYPQLVPRLASCFYWAVGETGPDDVPRYQRLFGPPPLDPHFHRLRALACDRGGDLKTAHEAWQAYEKEIASHPETWPPGQAARARALIWLHLGESAGKVPSAATRRKLPRGLRDVFDVLDMPRPLKPTAEECYQRALELAPDQIEPYRALVEHHVRENRPAQAERAARRLLERFPDDVATLTKLADLLHDEDDNAGALELLQRALRGNPLNRDLRGRVSAAHRNVARDLALAGRFDEARANFEASRSLLETADAAAVLAPWAACEFKAGDATRAEQLLNEARRHTPAPAVAYRMLVEAIRGKLPRPLKTRFEQEFKEGLSGPANPADALALLQYLTALNRDGVGYTGEKTHRAKVLAYLNKVRVAAWDERQLMGACDCLLSLKEWRRARTYAERGGRRFYENPYFPSFEASSYFLDQRGGMPHFRVRMLLSTAERLVRRWPADDRRERLVKEIRQRQQELDLLDPFGPRAAEVFGGFPFDDDDDYDDE